MEDKKTGMTVRDMQKYIVEKRAFLNFSSEPMQLLCGLASEVGEAASAIRREYLRKQPPLPDSDRSSLKNEIADVYIYLAAIAEAFGIDLETAVPHKMQMNIERYGPGKPESFVKKDQG
ncbi:MAG: hypothetical protein LBO78_03915 [Rickettsiales bacterium]|jgi:NTP pyrophosphatase (non-canonical NTP hydrolase)|nr:hypothetical protein [Rickettsiales bacterium]